MLKYVVLALCALALSEAAVISKSQVSVAKVHPFGIVEGIISCGSAGQILQVRVTDCTRVPCQTIVGRTYDIEIDFIPSASHSQLNLKVSLTHNGQTIVIVDAPVEGSAVEAGNTYTFTYQMTISSNFIGNSDLQIEIGADGVRELCGIAGLVVSPAVAKLVAISSAKSPVSVAEVHPFGIVEGIISCGSAGQIIQVRVTDCTRVPCQTIVGRTYDIEIDFIPSASHSQLNLKVQLTHNGNVYVIVDAPVPGSAVEAGKTYTFTYQMTISPNFIGNSDLQIEISADGVKELCGIAGLVVSPAVVRALAISPAKTQVSLAKVNPFGIVEGIISCGSAGQIIQVRVTDCTRVPCQTYVGRTYDIEIDFIPSASHSQLNLKVSLTHNGNVYVIVDAPVPGSAVEAGKTYTFTYQMTISPNFIGNSDLQIEISADGVKELCGIAGLIVSPAPGH